MKTLLFPKVLSLSLLLALGISFGSYAANSNSEPLVKQSSSGICHDKSSGSFNRTKTIYPLILLLPVSMLVNVCQKARPIR